MNAKKNKSATLMLVASILMAACLVMSIILVFTVGLRIDEIVNGSGGEGEGSSGGEALGKAILAIILIAYGYIYFWVFIALLILTVIPGIIAYVNNGQCVVWARVMGIIDLVFLGLGIFWVFAVQTFEWLTFITIIVEFLVSIVYIIGSFKMKRPDLLAHEIPQE